VGITIPISKDFSSNYLLCSKYLYLETIVRSKPPNYEWLFAFIYFFFIVTCSVANLYSFCLGLRLILVAVLNLDLKFFSIV
jgi:hypothetical protein